MPRPLQTGDHVILAWDDGVMGRGLNVTEARGIVVGWLASDPERRKAVVRLESTLEVAADSRELCVNFVTLATRYVGQKWDGDERTVHIFAHANDPRIDPEPQIWVASHGAWSSPDE